MLGDVPPSGSSGNPSSAHALIPPRMLYASNPTARKACVANAERRPIRHWKITGLSLGSSSARPPSRSSSMCVAPAIRPASHS